MDNVVANNQIVFFVISIVAAVVWLRQGITKSSITEATNLAKTRGEIIDDLHEDMAKRDSIWEAKCEVLATTMSELNGQMKLVQGLKIEQIVEGVQGAIADTVADELRKWDSDDKA